MYKENPIGKLKEQYETEIHKLRAANAVEAQKNKILERAVEECKQKLNEMKEGTVDRFTYLDTTSHLHTLTSEEFNALYNEIKGEPISINEDT